MEANNQNTDTPQQGSEQISVEDAFFNSTETQTNESQGAPVQETPEGDGAASQPQVNTQEYQAKNDERRFEYWQSQASKVQNENAQLKAQMQQVVQQPQQAQAPVEPEAEQFPPAPAKPETPAGFNRSEAFEDPNSASARYMNELDKWRDDTIQYNSLKSEYQNALIAEQLDAQQSQRVEEVKRAQHYQQQQQQLGDVYNLVQGEHGLSNEEAQEFIQTMSNPKSLSINNLVQLYKLQKGAGQQVGQQPVGPSDTFNQQARAQQVPSPMGVIPAQQSNSTVSTEDQVMDSMISDYKKSNPW